jgi:TolB-like protein
VSRSPATPGLADASPASGVSSAPSSPSEAGAGKSPGELSLLLQKLAADDEGDEAGFLVGLQPGQSVGRFEVLREIGRGGFGAVYEALDRELGRRVALKVLRPRRGRGPAAETLLAEARAICDLHHPGIVALFDIGDGPAGPFLVEELLRGETLEERLARGPLPVPEALPIAIAVARALSHAHRRGVVHRDLKPANVFLCEDGGVKLLDFGLAHLLGTRASPGAGTPAYMAPEQALGQEVDGRADVFAAAAVLHECLAGARPFDANEDGFPRFDAPPRPLPAAVPKALARAVRAGLALEPGARPAGGQAWLDALRRAERALERPARLRRLGALVAAGALLGAAIGGVLAWRGRPRLGDLPDEVRRTVAVLPFTPLSEDKEAEHLADGVQVEMIATLSQRPDLIVIGRSSVEAWRKPPRDLPAIAASLGVGSVLEGSVQRVGNRIRIVISMLDPRSGRSLWAERYDRDLSDVLAVQAEVAGHVARVLGGRLTATETRADTLRSKPEAYAAYLEGVGLYTRHFGVAADEAAALHHFELAVALDPDFAAALAYLGLIKWGAAREWQRANRSRLLREAREHAERAVALDPRLPTAHLAIYGVLFEEDRREEAGRAMDRAFALAPNDALIGSYTANEWLLQGRWREALSLHERMARLEPRDPSIAANLLMALMRLGRLDRAQALCEDLGAWMPKPSPVTDGWCALLQAWRRGDPSHLRALAKEATPDAIYYFGSTLVSLAPTEVLGRLADRDVVGRLTPYSAALLRGLAEERLQHLEAARQAFLEAKEFATAAARHNPVDPGPPVAIARALAYLGRGDEALSMARNIVAERWAKADRIQRQQLQVWLSTVAIRAGRVDVAVDALERSLGIPLWTTPAFLRVDPRFEALHGDPRFEAMLAKHAKLPELPDP